MFFKVLSSFKTKWKNKLKRWIEKENDEIWHVTPLSNVHYLRVRTVCTKQVNTFCKEAKWYLGWKKKSQAVSVNILEKNDKKINI